MANLKKTLYALYHLLGKQDFKKLSLLGDLCG